MPTHQFGRKIKLRDNRHQTSDQNAGMAQYDVEKSEAVGRAEVSRGQDHHLLDAVEARQIEHGVEQHALETQAARAGLAVDRLA